MECHRVFPKNPPIQKVRYWRSPSDVTDYFFVGSDWSEEIRKEAKAMNEGNTFDDGVIREAFGKAVMNSPAPVLILEPFFHDDTIHTIVLKLVGLLDLPKDSNIIPYLWADGSPLRFRFVKNPWKKYVANPFLCPSKGGVLAPEIQQLPDKIVRFTDLELTTHGDVVEHFKKDKTAIRYFFPNEKDILRSTELQGSLYEHKLLKQLWYKPSSAHQALLANASCSYSRASLAGRLVGGGDDSYRVLFEKIHSSKLFPFVRFNDDENHIYYKVWKEHSLPEVFVKDWTNPANFVQQTALTLYSQLKEGGSSFAKVYLTEKGRVQVTYRMESSENITHDLLQQHISDMSKELFRIWGKKMDLVADRLAVRTSLYVKDIELKDLSVTIAKLLPIFNIPKKTRAGKTLLDLQYKRVEKYGESKNIYEFIKSKIDLEVPLFEIMLELQEYGVEEEEVRSLFEQIQRQGELPADKKPKRNYSNMGLLMHLSIISMGALIYIDNATNFEEIQNALFWLRAAILEWQGKRKKKPVASVASVASDEAGPSVPVPGPGRPVSPLELTPPEVMVPVARQVSSASSSASSSPLSLGGAIGPEYQRFFKKRLEDADKDVFEKTKNYARKCQITDLRQPIVMSKEQKKKVDALGYGDGYDDFLEYGSDPKQQNVYMCPKIYCPDEQIPLSYEKYVANGNKCPDPKDKPILLYTTDYWYNDPLRKHYVGYLKDRGFNDVKLPCCFKLPKVEKQEEKETKRTTVVVQKKKGDVVVEAPRVTQEDFYIIDKPRKLEEGRLGTIPNSLHEFLYEDVPYNQCKNTIKGNECLLRRGVVNGKDSLMESIAYLLDFPSKKELVDHIYKVLDPLTFLSLENGQVYTYFLPKEPVRLDREKKKELRTWLDRHRDYRTQFQLEDVVIELGAGAGAERGSGGDEAVGFKTARQAMIYDSFRKFLLYLRDDEPKNPYLLFDLVHFLGAVLVVWNRDSVSLATIRCPFATKNKKWFMGRREVPFILVLQQDTYYEPLVIVQSDSQKSVTQKIGFTRFEKLFSILGTCPAMAKQEDDLIHRIYSLSLWTETILSDPKSFRLYSLVLDPSDRIVGVTLWNNLFIEFPGEGLSMFSLKNLLDLCEIPYVVYWEDIQHKSVDIRMPVADFRLLGVKLEKLGFGYRLGTIREIGEQIRSLYVVPGVVYPAPPKIPIVIEDAFTGVGARIDKENRSWYKTKKTLLEKLWKEHDDLVAPLLSKSREEGLEKLRGHFEYLQQPSRVAVLLEEIPWVRKDLVEKMYQKHLLERPYKKGDQIQEGYRKKEWIFTQQAVEKGNIDDIQRPTKIRRPRGEPKVEKETMTSVSLPHKDPLPVLLRTDELEEKTIPSKWRTSFWKNYKIGMVKDGVGSGKEIIELMGWIARQKGLYLDTDDLTFYLRKEVLLMLENPDLYEALLEDLSMRKTWSILLKRQFRNVRDIIENGFEKKKVKDLQQLWKNAGPDLWIQDLDLVNLSKLLQVSFLVLQKGKAVQDIRGNIDELIASSNFISSIRSNGLWRHQPVLVMYKSKADDDTHPHYDYGIVFSSKSNGYYSTGSALPVEMQKLIEGHL